MPREKRPESPLYLTNTIVTWRIKIRLRPHAPRPLTAAWLEDFVVRFEHSPFGGANRFRLKEVLLQKGGALAPLAPARLCVRVPLPLRFPSPARSLRLAHFAQAWSAAALAKLASADMLLQEM